MAHTHYETNGALIMRLAEDVIRPFLLKKLNGCHDEDGLLVQPANMRGLAISMAQEWVKYYQSTVH